jgi:autotransporter-associated beta strand repeat/autotransporter-associated beta strand repeat/autotransporter-associated beta strand repeat
LNGGEFVFKGTGVAATNAAESVGVLNIASGFSTVTAFSGTGGSTTLTFASMSHTKGASVLFRGDTLGGTAGAGVANIIITTAPSGADFVGGNTSLVNKPIIPYAIGDTSNSGTGFGFVTYNINPASNAANTTGVRPLVLATEYSTATGTAGVNLKLDTASVSPNVTRAFNSLLFSGGFTYTIGSGGGNKTLTLTSGSIFSATGATNIITGRAADVLALAAVEGNLFTIGNLTHSTSLFSGTGGLTKSAAGIYLENASVAVSGGLFVNQGTLRSGIASAFATAQALTVRAGSSAAPGTFDLNTFNNSITTLALESGSTAGSSITMGTGTLTLGGDITHTVNGTGATGATIAGNLALGASRIFTVNDGSANTDLTISALVSGATFGITKSGAGTLVLNNGSNSYTGQTIISAGTLSATVLANSGTVSSIGTGAASPIINIGATGVFQYTGTGHSTSRVIALTASGGSIDASGSGTMTLSGGVTGNTFALVLTGTGSGIESGVIGTTIGTLTKAGSGSWTLSGANTFSGGANLNLGTLNLGISSTGAITNGPLGTGTLTFGGGTLAATASSWTVANPYTISTSSNIGGTNSFTLSGSGVLNSSQVLTATNTSGTITLSGALSSSGALTVNGVGGTLLLSNANTYTGNTTITNGILSIRNIGGLGTGTGTQTTAVSIASGGTLDINFNSGSNQTLSNNTIALITSTSGTITGSNVSGGLDTISNNISLVSNSTINGSGLLSLTGIISDTS